MGRALKFAYTYFLRKQRGNTLFQYSINLDLCVSFLLKIRTNNYVLKCSTEYDVISLEFWGILFTIAVIKSGGCITYGTWHIVHRIILWFRNLLPAFKKRTWYFMSLIYVVAASPFISYKLAFITPPMLRGVWNTFKVVSVP